MECLTSNFQKTTRRETLHGRSFLVAPLTLIVPGVLSGSQGALFYSREEIAKNVDAWNGMPLTVRHPRDSSGKSVSGRTPAANENHGVGNVYNAKIVDGNLVGEGWFDLQATRNLSPEITVALEDNQQIELSTGLFTDNKKAPEGSEHNGEPFSFFATNLRPDHLAILTDQVGACSLEDGCGVLNKGQSNDSHASEHETISGNVGQNRETNNSTKNGDGQMALTQKEKTELVAELIANCEYCDDSDTASLNELSDEKLLLRQADMQKRIADTAVVNAVQEFAGDTPAEGLVEFITNAAAKKNVDDEEDDEEMDPAEKAKLIALKKNKDKPTKNEGDTQKTEAEIMAELPESVQNALRFANGILAEKKGEIIAQIIANVEDEAQREAVANQLKGKEIEELRVLSALAPKPAPATNVSYMGAQGSTPVENDGFDESDILVSPTMEW